MTQKEYKEKIEFLENRAKGLMKENEALRLQEYKYEQVLENYHRVSEELKQEREYNMQNCKTIDNLQSMIRHYEKMFDKVSFQVIDGNRY